MSKYEGELVDGKGECPNCGGYYSIKASGEMRSHNCSGITVVEAGPQPAKKTTSSRSKRTPARSKEVPDAVAKLTTALVVSAVEAITQSAIARAVPMSRDLVPELAYTVPEPDDMIKPFIALAWPQLPGKAQRVARDIADHSDVIEALFMWQEWLMTMRQFTREARAYHRAQLQGENPNVVTIPLATQGTGTGPSAAGFTPFEPAGEPAS